MVRRLKRDLFAARGATLTGIVATFARWLLREVTRGRDDTDNAIARRGAAQSAEGRRKKARNGFNLNTAERWIRGSEIHAVRCRARLAKVVPASIAESFNFDGRSPGRVRNTRKRVDKVILQRFMVPEPV